MLRSQRCDRVREWICVELDGELSRFERALVDAHLEGCADCVEFRESTQAFTAMLRDAPLEPIEHAIAIPTRRVRVLRARSMQAVAAVAAIAVVALGSVASSLEQGSRAQAARLGPPVSVERPSDRDQLRLRQLRQRAIQAEIAYAETRPPGPQLTDVN